MRRWGWPMVLAVVLLLVMMPVGASAAVERGNYAAGKYALELDGTVVGWVSSVEGGHAVADVVTEKIGGDWLARKHLANVKYEEITFQAGATMTEPFYAWMAAMLSGKAERRSGSIIYVDDQGMEIERLRFEDALLSEVGFPALDAASKDPAYLTVKLAPRRTQRSVPDKPGEIQAPDGKKTWLPSNFRLKIDGLEEPCQRVSKVEALVVKQRVTETGQFWLDSSDLSFALTVNPLHRETYLSGVNPLYEAAGETLRAFATGAQVRERAGTLEYQDTAGRPIFTLSFSGLGLYRVAPQAVERGQALQVMSRAYVQPQLGFQYHGE